MSKKKVTKKSHNNQLRKLLKSEVAWLSRELRKLEVQQENAEERAGELLEESEALSEEAEYLERKVTAMAECLEYSEAALQSLNDLSGFE